MAVENVASPVGKITEVEVPDLGALVATPWDQATEVLISRGTWFRDALEEALKLTDPVTYLLDKLFGKVVWIRIQTNHKELLGARRLAHVFLTNDPGMRIALIKEVRSETSLNLKEAKAVVDQTFMALGKNEQGVAGCDVLPYLGEHPTVKNSIRFREAMKHLDDSTRRVEELQRMVEERTDQFRASQSENTNLRLDLTDAQRTVRVNKREEGYEYALKTVALTTSYGLEGVLDMAAEALGRPRCDPAQVARIIKMELVHWRDVTSVKEKKIRVALRKAVEKDENFFPNLSDV